MQSAQTSVPTKQKSLAPLPALALQVYLTASTVYGLEGQLTNLEDAARKINSVTAESELADLEDQVATAAAQVHHAELQVRMAAPPRLQVSYRLALRLPFFPVHTYFRFSFAPPRTDDPRALTASQELSRA